MARETRKQYAPRPAGIVLARHFADGTTESWPERWAEVFSRLERERPTDYARLMQMLAEHYLSLTERPNHEL